MKRYGVYHKEIADGRHLWRYDKLVLNERYLDNEDGSEIIVTEGDRWTCIWLTKKHWHELPLPVRKMYLKKLNSWRLNHLKTYK